MADESNPIADTLTYLTEEAVAGSLSYLIIGGNALIHYGVIRMTRDVDFLIPATQKEKWIKLLLGKEYELYHEAGSFLQFESKLEIMPPVDLMMVDEQTWQKLEAEKVISKTQKSYPSIFHLIAMKLHAYRQEQRASRDWDDVVQLLIEQGIDPKEGKAIEPFAGFLSEEEKIKLKKDYERSRESGG